MSFSISVSSPGNVNQHPSNSLLHRPNQHVSQTFQETTDPERIADALLEAVGVLSEGSGIYTTAQLDRKIRNERKRLPEVEEYGLPQEVIAELVERRIDELIDLSRLTVSQEVVFRLHLCGLSVRCIAATLKISQNKAAYHLRKAKRKIRAAYSEGRYAGWYEVYLSEVNRPAYRRPKQSLQC